MRFRNSLAYWYLRHVRRIVTPKRLIRFAMSHHAKRVFAVHGGREMNYREVEVAANRLANALIARSVGKGAVVATLLQNSLEAAIVRIAAYKAGWIFCALIDDLPPQEIPGVLSEVGAMVLLIDEANWARIDLSQLKPCTSIRLIISTKQTAGAVCLTDLLASGEAGEPDVEIAPGDFAAIGFTSGTTGRSKGVVWTQSSWMESFYNLLRNRRDGGRSDEVFLHVIPFSTAGSLLLLPCLVGGMRNVYLAAFNPRVVCETIQQHHVTRMFLAPVFLVDLWDFYVADGRKYDLRSLRSIHVGSAPMSAAKYLAVQQDLGIRLDHGYGMAEVLAPLTAHRGTGAAVQPGQPLSVGQAADGVQIRVVDPDKAGHGQLAIRSLSCAVGYWNRPEATEQSFVHGWFVSHDIGYLDEHQQIYVLDRKEDVFMRDGCKVYPRRIEEWLHTCTAVKDVAVVERQGKLVAFVTVRRDHRLDAGELQKYCEPWLLPHERPDAIEVVHVLPVSTSGKVLKRIQEMDKHEKPNL